MRKAASGAGWWDRAYEKISFGHVKFEMSERHLDWSCKLGSLILDGSKPMSIKLDVSCLVIGHQLGKVVAVN